jgi:hypothetical protein
MVSSENGEEGGGSIDPQFQMFDESPSEYEIGWVNHDGERWALVLQTRECADRLFRGRFLFRCKGRELRTTDLFIEPTYEQVLDRAQSFEDHLVNDLIRSLL